MTQKWADLRIANKRSKQSQNNYRIKDYKRYRKRNVQDLSEKIYLKPLKSWNNDLMLCHCSFY